MEADWEFEVGGDAPVIEPCWSGFVDLRKAPARASELIESVDFPGLGHALERLNSQSSPVWTSKCDFWPGEREAIDADELAADSNEAASILCLYIDLLPGTESMWSSAMEVEAACRGYCALLAPNSLRCCRVDLIIRHALIGERMGFGLTAYVTSCGAGPTNAAATLEKALDALAAAVCSDSTLQ